MLIAVNTITNYDYEELIEYLIYNGSIWNDGRAYIPKIWNRYGTSTCIVIRDEFLTYCGKSFAICKLKLNILSTSQYYYKFHTNRFQEKFDLR